MAILRQLAGLSPLVLTPGCTVTFEALDAEGAGTVSGVTVSEATVYWAADEPSVRPDAHDPAFTHAGSET